MPEKLETIIGWYAKVITDPQQLKSVPDGILTSIERARILDRFYGFIRSEKPSLQDYVPSPPLPYIGQVMSTDHKGYMKRLQCRAFAEELAHYFGFAVYRATQLERNLPDIAVERQAQIGTDILKAIVEEEFKLQFTS